MLGPIVEFFERLISDFSWQRVGLLALLLFFAVIGLFVYEEYTESFMLGRMDKRILLLERLVAISESDALMKQPETKLIYEELLGELARSGNRNALRGAPDAIKKLLAAALPWALLIIAIYIFDKDDAEKTFTWEFAFGMCVIAFPFLIIGLIIPTFERSWINYIVYPFGHIALVIWGVLRWQRSQGEKNAAG